MRCNKCGTELHEYYEQNGRNYCPVCIQDFWPKCAICGRPMNRWIESKDGKKYCGPECREADLPHCCICGKPVDQWIKDSKDNIYCSETCFKESCPRCDACGKRMRTWRYTQTGIRCCNEMCFSKIEKIIDWYERENVAKTPFKSFALLKADFHKQDNMVSFLAFLLITTGLEERGVNIIIRKVCSENGIHQPDLQYYMRKAYSLNKVEIADEIRLVTNDVINYFYAQIVLLTGISVGTKQNIENIAEVLSILMLTKYEIRFLCNRIVEHLCK